MEILERAGVEVHYAAAPLAVLSLSKTLPALDAVVADVVTSDGRWGGLDLLIELRADARTAELLVILTTALSETDLSGDDPRLTGPVVVLRKPFDEDGLAALIHGAYEKVFRSGSP